MDISLMTVRFMFIVLTQMKPTNKHCKLKVF